MIRITKYINYWRNNLAAYIGITPEQGLMIHQYHKALVEEAVKSGLIKEAGMFPDNSGGYTIYEGEVEEVYKYILSTTPFFINEIHEFIPLEKSLEINTANVENLAELSKQMK